MDTALNLPTPTTVAAAPAPVTDRAVTTKVAPIDAADTATTRPSEKPFVARIVSARLSGTEFPENPGEIAPPERTLRPYDVPMLPYEDAEIQTVTDGGADVADPDTGNQPERTTA